MFELDLPALQANMTDKAGNIEHHTGNRILLFPFPGNDTKIKDLQEDLVAFKGVAGAFYRESLKQSPSSKFDRERFLQRVCSEAQAPGNSYLKDIVENIAFDGNGQLIAFNAKVLPYLDHYVKNKTLDDISRYLFHLFLDQEQVEQMKMLAEKEPTNLLHRLILSCLPEMRETSGQWDQMYRAPNKVRQKFREDFQTLTQDHDFFIAGFPRLLKFYFLQYLTDLVFELGAFIETRKSRYFFSLSWEKLQGSRLASVNGWQLFEKHVNTMFSHANTLELLNHINGLGEEPVTYLELRELVESLDPTAKANLHSQVEKLIEYYASRVTKGKSPFPWDNESFSDTYPDEPILNSVHRLWEMVDVQFRKSPRERIYKAYRRWFMEFAKLNYTRRRGRNGYSLSLDHEEILFLTKLCIGPSESKIRLSKLWEELEERGVFFDQASKATVVEYFEKINLLEKKSDSGDAQYVRKLS